MDKSRLFSMGHLLNFWSNVHVEITTDIIKANHQSCMLCTFIYKILSNVSIFIQYIVISVAAVIARHSLKQ